MGDVFLIFTVKTLKSSVTQNGPSRPPHCTWYELGYLGRTASLTLLTTQQIENKILPASWGPHAE